MKEILKYVNLSKVKTFDPQNSNYGYKLKASIFAKITAIYGIKILEEFERNNDVIIALRGVARDEYFRDYQLGKFFIVGEKSKYYLTENKRELYSGDFNDKHKLISNINKLIDKLNKIITERENKHPICGRIPYISEDISIDELRIEKLVYLSALHNIGGRWNEKKSSPFMSVTYGKDKLNTALKFCKCNKNKDIGFIFIYFIPQNNKYHIKTEKLNQLMKELGVTWYKDIHREMMMIDGILPHYLFGILEICDNETHELIINPWLYNQFKNKYKFIPTEGILIDQTDFKEYAKELGYKKYYYQTVFKRQQYNIDNILLDECVEFHSR